MPGFPVISYEDGRIFCASTNTLLDIRRQLHLTPLQKFALVNPKKNVFLEVKDQDETQETSSFPILQKNNNEENDGATMTPSTSVEVSPRDFYIPSNEYSFAGLTSAQRVFGCAATSVRLLSKQQYNVMASSTSQSSSSTSESSTSVFANIRPTASLPRFFVCSKIANWSGKKSLSSRLFNSTSSSNNSNTKQEQEDDINFASAVLKELALMLSARGSNNIIQLKSMYFAPDDKENRDLYVVCEEGPTEITTDIATFASKVLPVLKEQEQEEIQEENSISSYSSAEAVALSFDACRQLLDGVAHLHELGVVHGGITPRNMLASKVNHHLQNYPAHSYWKFYLRDLGLIEAAALRYRTKDQLCFRKFFSSVTSGSGTTRNKPMMNNNTFLNNNHDPFYRPDETSDEDLCLRYASPECLVGAPPTNSSDIWSCGMILSEMMASVFTPKFTKEDRFDPLVEDCGRGGGFLVSHRSLKEDLWDRITSGSGFPVSWKEAKNRYASTVRVPFTKKDYFSGNLHSTTSKLIKSIQEQEDEIMKVVSSSDEEEKPMKPIISWSKSRTLENGHSSSSATSNNAPTISTLNTDIAVARILSSSPANPWKNQSSTSRSAAAASISLQHHQDQNRQLIDDCSHHQKTTSSTSAGNRNNNNIASLYQLRKQEEDDETVLSLARAYATAEGVTSPQRKFTVSSVSPTARSVYETSMYSTSSNKNLISPLVGDFAIYLSRRHVPEQVGQVLLSMMHFYPERRPTAVRCRMNPAFYQNSSSSLQQASIVGSNQNSTNPSAKSASVRLHFAQKVDQSELHLKILAVIDSVCKRESAASQSDKLMQLAWLLDGLIKRGSMLNNFGRILEEILMSKPGVKKVEDELIRSSHANYSSKLKASSAVEDMDEEVQMENKLKRLLGHSSKNTNSCNETDVFNKSPTAIFTADSTFSGMSTLQSMMKIFVCIANAKV